MIHKTKDLPALYKRRKVLSFMKRGKVLKLLKYVLIFAVISAWTLDQHFVFYPLISR